MYFDKSNKQVMVEYIKLVEKREYIPIGLIERVNSILESLERPIRPDTQGTITGQLYVHRIVKPSNHVIEAIKTTRTHFGMGLKESKDLVEQGGYIEQPVTLDKALKYKKEMKQCGMEIDLVDFPDTVKVLFDG